ncbi:MAG: hypothetical protein AB7N61_07265 [Acidimicrobiia bacterium]
MSATIHNQLVLRKFVMSCTSRSVYEVIIALARNHVISARY